LRMRFIGRCLVRFSRLIRSIQCSRMFFPQLKLGTTSCGRCQRATTRLPDSLALALSVAQQALRLDSVCYFFSGSEVAIAFGKMPGIGARFFSSRSGVGSGFRGSI